jgi:two-component system response regulator MprA
MSELRRILLVDDDPEALEMLCEFFADEGYTVETAADGVGALAKLDGFAPDVIVTDYEMPGMSGVELIRLVQARRPGQAVLLLSAREDCVISGANGLLPGLVACLQKPVDLDDLSVVVRKLIDDARDLDDDAGVALP